MVVPDDFLCLASKIIDVRNWASDYLRIWRNNKAVKAISAPTCPTIKTLLKRNECTNQPFFLQKYKMVFKVLWPFLLVK